MVKKSNLKPPKKPDGFSDLYSVLKGRYYGCCILASGELDLKLEKEILNECKNNRVSYFLEEVVPALLVIQEYDFLTLLFENYYEDIFEFGVWSSTTTQSIYLIALAWLNCEKNDLKIARKNLDFIVLNSLNDDGAGFGYDTNKITILDRNNNVETFELKAKSEVATDIFNKIISLL